MALSYDPIGGAPARPLAPRWGWIELFVAIQLLWGVLLFVPGTQPIRAYIRALPYLCSLGALPFYFRDGTVGRLPASCRWLLAAMVLLVLNLLHEQTYLLAGVGQVVFQLAIAAPMFWVARAVRTDERLLSLLWIIFAASFASAAVGVLQVYYPDRLLPPEFSSLARTLNADYVDALTYIGVDGRRIVRPPGLSDLPGGAAISGLTTMVLGIALGARERRSSTERAVCLGAAVVGMTALYLTQVRSMTIMAVLSVGAFALIKVRQGHTLKGGFIAVGGLGLVAAAFVWASTLAGESLLERFASLFDTGVMTTFQENRGLFLEYTLNEMLYEFPLGAGLGRWGMMQVYFSDPAMWQAPPIHVEIQLTGWLLDGGVLMWVLYGGALFTALRLAYLLAIRGATERLQYSATIVLAVQLIVVGLCLTGPVFNTQLGILFWTMSAALFGAAAGWQESGEMGGDGAEMGGDGDSLPAKPAY